MAVQTVESDSIAGSVNGLEGPEESKQLTARQREVLSEIFRGFTRQQAADHLFISVKTIDRHLNDAFETLDARNSRQAINEALRRGEL